MNTTTAIILGGGRGTRLYPLTLKRAKPAVGFAGKYRIIDIPVSNCINSGIKRIFVLTQFLSASLHRHIMQTYRFDEFTDGFVDILAAEQTVQQSDWFQGPADAVRATLRVQAQRLADRDYVGGRRRVLIGGQRGQDTPGQAEQDQEDEQQPEPGGGGRGVQAGPPPGAARRHRGGPLADRNADARCHVSTATTAHAPAFQCRLDLTS